MQSLFLRQFTALLVKNWIVLFKHPFLNILRCFVLPVAYGIFLAVAQVFLVKPSNFGLGSSIPVYNLTERFDGSLTLIWADGTDGTGFPSPADIMSSVTSSFSPKQLDAVKQVESPDDIPSSCPQNFNLFSDCFAAVAFNSIPAENNTLAEPFNYTIRADGGLSHIDVVKHSSDYEIRVLPLQWALDSAIMELRTGQRMPTPLEWPFTQETNAEQSTKTRLSYIRGLRTLLVLALFICYIGVAYHLPGSFMGERALSLTSHLKVMGLLDSARIISWHISISLAYLPAWIIVSIIWHLRIFSGTSGGLVFVIHLIFGLSLASWSLFVAVPFGKSPQLAAVASTFFSLLFAILALVMGAVGSGTAFIFTLIFPPGFYVFSIRTIAGFENHQIPTSAVHADPDSGMTLLPILIAGIIDIFLWPWIATLLERRMYDAREPPSSRGWRFWKKKPIDIADQIPSEMPEDTAISIRHLNKTFQPNLFHHSQDAVTAISDLSLDIPKFGIFVLLGSNGAGKSTALSIIAGLLGRTKGSITFEGGISRPPRGVMGIVPQKNVLFPELTCYQNIRVWQAVKHSDHALAASEDLEQLLRDCDLEKKVHENASTLSGGQKRKLQLACGLVGGSKIVLVDEATSGVDPLARRALWRTLTSVRNERTIIFTTHFLDEADLLADRIAILAAPGKLVAEGSPVTLKSTLGEGYTIQVTFQRSEDEKAGSRPSTGLLESLRGVAPLTYTSSPAMDQMSYHLKSKDPIIVERVLELLDENTDKYKIASYDVQGTSVEEVFLGLMNTDTKKDSDSTALSDDKNTTGHTPSETPVSEQSTILQLTNGKKVSVLTQALTIFHKRIYVARRSWLTPLLLVAIAIAGSCIPLFFMAGRPQSCTTTFLSATSVPLYFPDSPLLTFFSADQHLLTSPPNIASTLGPTVASLGINNVANNATFVEDVNQNYLNLSRGGISIDLDSGQALIAWEASSPGLGGPTMLNLASNILFNRALNNTGLAAASGDPVLIQATYENFPVVDAGTLIALKWVAFFGASMAAYTAFFSLYVSRERRSSVQAMQFSNGLSNPVGLWLGHLLFDTIFVLVLSTIIVIVFKVASNQFHGLGFYWLILVLYGIAGALFAYCVSLFTASPLAAFAICAAYQIIIFTAYIASYLLTLTYAKTSKSGQIINILHFTLSLLSPVASIMRTAFVSVNLFSLLCLRGGEIPASQYAGITRYGGPILYLIVYAFALFFILVWIDSGSLLPRNISAARRRRELQPVVGASALDNGALGAAGAMAEMKVDVEDEAKVVGQSDDPLRVLHVSKTFGLGRGANKVVDDVSLGVGEDMIFALLGPNGAGKTTTFNLIRGDIMPDHGDILLNGISVVRHPRSARLGLGVCPQFTAIDSQLTVREHLDIYGRLKGISRGSDLRRNVDLLMQGTGLDQYADRLASKLSGGNQRKLSLAIALMGNPRVILIDEFSTGIDAKMKREMWGTLQRISVGKAIVITTHSMEEASALADKVAIIATRLLAVGTTESLAARYAMYEVHFSCRDRDDVARAQRLMARIPGARMADDVATRFEVPIGNSNLVEESNRDGSDSETRLSLAELFHILSSEGDFSEYSVERATLESVFLKVIRQNNVAEEDQRTRMGRSSWWKRLRRG